MQIASRLWHEPFGLFIDATCYSGRAEPPDEFFATLDLLTPSELSLNLSRIYVYNMNSAFKSAPPLINPLKNPSLADDLTQEMLSTFVASFCSQ